MPHLTLHLTSLVALMLGLGVVAVRIVLRVVKIAVLIAAPALLYLLHQH